MGLEIKSHSMIYRLEDESGYRFDISVSLDQEFGWGAYVHFHSDGLKTPDRAVEKLGEVVEQFLKQLREHDFASPKL